jgi:hypothetical protein
MAVTRCWFSSRRAVGVCWVPASTDSCLGDEPEVEERIVGPSHLCEATAIAPMPGITSGGGPTYRRS